MQGERVFFQSGEVTIEGIYTPGDGSKGAVITHPHSQMGGNMMNNVVDALVSAFHDHGYATLKFNFRGVGRSGGSFDNGIGEQDDVKGAIAFLKEKGLNDIALAGYSFGAWVNSKVLPGYDGLSPVVMVSPPVDFLEFDFSHLKEKCNLIICGDRDQFCPLRSLEKIAGELGCRLDIVRGADHFYFGKEQVIIDYLGDYLG
ncbi:MAG TPA: CocE/NonD family hydrolase [Syntrophales bacterium]|nr:CocE/NonD family hydrolase [Syntrophales bacterium]HPQ44169.1 CocE/NonD family hydrolase [Syntrophales bacterium]